MIKFLISALLGAMIFFISIITPTVFNSLDEENSRLFLRRVFPKLFLFAFFILILCTIITFYEGLYFTSAFLFLNSMIFIVNRNFITPRINKAKDESLMGNNKSDNLFKSLHRISVLLFLFSMISLVVIIINLSISVDIKNSYLL